MTVTEIIIKKKPNVLLNVFTVHQSTYILSIILKVFVIEPPAGSLESTWLFTEEKKTVGAWNYEGKISTELD